MAIIGVDLGSDQTITAADLPADESNIINITALGSGTLTVDGTSASIGTVVAGVGVADSPTFSAINGGELTINQGLLSVGALQNVTYNVGDTSTINVTSGLANLDLSAPPTVQFTGEGEGVFNFTAPTALASSFNVQGLSTGDQLLVNGRTSGTFQYDEASQTGTVTYPGGALGIAPVTYNIQGLSPEDAAQIPSTFDDGFTMPVCFLRGTMVLTPTGEVAIEDLQPGDQVIGQSGVRTVKWVGFRKTITARIPQQHRADHMPIRIMRDAIAQNVPSKDIVVSPGHHILFEGKLIRARDILNGKTIVQETHLRSYEYFHVELDQFDVISAHGLMSESWADGGNRDYFQNVDVTSLRAEDRERRKADRPGFDALRKEKDIAPLHAKLDRRADEILAAVTQVKAA